MSARVAQVVVVGGMNVDVKARSAAPVVAGTSNPGTVARSAGGVGRNVAENLARLGTPTALVSAVGRDADGDWLLALTAAAGVDVAAVARTEVATGTYAAVLDATGELVVAVSAMAAADVIGPSLLPDGLVAAADLLVLDGNLAGATVDAALDLAAAHGVRAVVEPVSVPKARRLRPLLDRRVFAVTPNRDELAALGSVAALHEAGVEVVWVRDGAAGSVVHTRDGVVELAAPPADVVDVTGAGDAMLAAFCHRLLRDGDLAAAAADGHRAAAITVAGPATVVPDLRARMEA